MRRLYTLLFYILLPAVLLRLWLRARKNPVYMTRIGERFGIIPKPIPPNGLWIHAVSVGEVIAAIPLIKIFQTRHPDIPIVITTNTPTGADRVTAAFGDKVTHLYVPYDLPEAWQRFLNAVKPRCLVIMETELWPNMLYSCSQRKIPILLANARLSAKSAAGYRRVYRLSHNMLQQIDIIAAQAQADADRFFILGCESARLKIVGSVKFDLEISEELKANALQLREAWGQDRLVWIAASTHETEEEQILKAFTDIRERLPNALLVLVPRHPERFERVTALCKRSGFNVVLRSEKRPCNPDTQIFIGDSMGELLLFYAASDVAFVGGSLVPTGGHNPLEPVALGLPVVMGPHVFNFAAISEQLQAVGAMIQIESTDQLAEEVTGLLHNATQRQHMGEKGKAFVAQNRGAVMRHIEILEGLLS